jgi:alkylresorcinol/alkylpyrone synthase
MAKITGIATAVPPHALDQADVSERVRAQFSHSSVVSRLMPVFANTGIERRYSCVPIDWYYDEHRWPDRNAIYRESAVSLLEDAALRALLAAGRRVGDVDTIVVVSTTGIATPSLDALLMERLPFKRTVRRLPVFGLGCVGGAIGIARATAMADAHPGSVVLLLVVELCALWFRRDEISKSNVVATALFGDGAAAMILASEGAGPRVVASGEYTFPNSLDIMGWDVADDGLSAIFSRDIPHLVETELRGVVDSYLAQTSLRRSDIDVFLSHPGGTKVLDALESAFDIETGALVDSRITLREYGNMSAVTLLFVLERALREGALANASWHRALCTAMGPGFTTAFVTLER